MKTTFKLLAISTLVIFSFQSCEKKTEASNQIHIDTMKPGPPNPTDVSIKKAQSKPLTTIALSENYFDFGVIKKGDIKSHTYEITNTGTNPLIISEVKPGCGCTVPEFTKEPILPGKKGQITLKFNSENFDSVVNKTADVYANIAKAPFTINFTADIK